MSQSCYSRDVRGGFDVIDGRLDGIDYVQELGVVSGLGDSRRVDGGAANDGDLLFLKHNVGLDGLVEFRIIGHYVGGHHWEFEALDKIAE
jgi:hypothetical protein